MDLELEGKRALVTGGSRGIGKAVARALAREGVAVALLARDRDRLAAAAAELSAEFGRRVVAVVADTGSDADVERAVAPQMQARGWGRIVNVSGLAARQSGNAIGSIRNVAVAALTKNLADELGPSGINVTVVHPGLTRTERTAAMVAAQADAQGVSEATILQRMAEGNSIRHLVDASEVADVVAFLCSPKSVAINGDAIAAGGGAPRAIHY